LSRVTTVVAAKCAGVGPAPDPASALAGAARAALAEAEAAWARFAPHEALEATWRLIAAANAELEAAEPWKLDPGPAVDAVLGSALEVLRIVALLVQPAVPDAAAEIWRRIGLAGTPADGRLPGDAAWGGYPGGRAVEKGAPLFPRRRD
jgi:methionyl-tRNA synthetase